MRYEIECCRNCEGRDDKGFCEDILEPLRRGWGLDGIGPLQMPDSAHCKMFRVSESFRQEEEAAEREAGAGELERYFEKYARMQSKKGYTGREWRMRVTRNLMGRGFGSDSIRRAFEEYEENQDNEGME